MRINSSLEWNKLSNNLRGQMHEAPQNCRKDLARMLGRIEGLVHRLGSEEVEMRRCKKTTSPRQQDLLTQIDEAISEYEKWLMFAHLANG